MNEIKTLVCLGAAGFCAKFAYADYQEWQKSQLANSVADGFASMVGQKSNIDFGADARNEMIAWSVGAVICIWLAFKKSKKEAAS